MKGRNLEIPGAEWGVGSPKAEEGEAEEGEAEEGEAEEGEGVVRLGANIEQGLSLSVSLCLSLFVCPSLHTSPVLPIRLLMLGESTVISDVVVSCHMRRRRIHTSLTLGENTFCIQR